MILDGASVPSGPFRRIWLLEDRMYSRRDLAKIALGAFSAGRLLGKPSSTIRGVTIGVHSRSFRDSTLEDALAAMAKVGIGTCELWEGHVAPPRLSRKGLREWRETIAIEQFQLAASTASKAGVKIHAYNYEFAEDFSDLETQRGFEMAKALGAGVITASPSVAMVRTLNAAAVRAGLFVGLRNGDGKQPGDLSNPDELVAAVRGNANIRICLDAVAFAAAGNDVAKFLVSHLDRTATVCLRDHGEKVAFGQNNALAAAVLRQVQGRRATFPVMIDYDSQGADPVDVVDRSFTFCKQILTAKYVAPPAPARKT
jgi:sugar phosphate isomerase/epimerase